MAQKRILVSCGTAVATSTVVARKLDEILKERGYDVVIEQCKAAEAAAKAADFDLIVATTQINNAGNTPVIRTVSFLTGIGVDQDIEKIIETLGLN